MQSPIYIIQFRPQFGYNNVIHMSTALVTNTDRLQNDGNPAAEHQPKTQHNKFEYCTYRVDKGT